MGSKKTRFALLFFVVAGLAALAAIYTGPLNSLIGKNDPGIPPSSATGQRRFFDRIPGIPGERRTHRLAADKTGYTSRPDEKDPYSKFPLNIDVEHVSAKDAPFEDGDLVMGVVINGEARAYPVNYMMGPANEIVNDTLGGQAIAPTW